MGLGVVTAVFIWVDYSRDIPWNVLQGLKCEDVVHQFEKRCKSQEERGVISCPHFIVCVNPRVNIYRKFKFFLITLKYFSLFPVPCSINLRKNTAIAHTINLI